MSGIEELPIAQVLTVDSPVRATSFGDAADQIWLYSTASMDWVRYYYKHTGRGTSKKVIGWVKESTDSDSAVETLDTVKNGDGFFFKRALSGDGNITISGAIKATSAEPKTFIQSSLNFVCNPWPASIKVSDITAMLSNPISATSFGDSADQIWFYDMNAMDWVRYYYKHTGRGTSKTVIGWVKESEDSATAAETTDSIAVGQGFFFKQNLSGSGTLTFVKPVGL